MLLSQKTHNELKKVVCSVCVVCFLSGIRNIRINQTPFENYACLKTHFENLLKVYMYYIEYP